MIVYASRGSSVLHLKELYLENGILLNLDIQDLTHRVYNFRKVTFPEREHLNWCKQQSSRHEYKWVGSNHFGLEENRQGEFGAVGAQQVKATTMAH